MVDFHEVDVQQHPHQRDEYGTRQDSGILCEKKHNVGNQPDRTSVHHYVTQGHLGRTDGELPAETGVILAR